MPAPSVRLSSLDVRTDCPKNGLHGLPVAFDLIANTGQIRLSRGHGWRLCRTENRHGRVNW
ncbi:hypothetical protein MTBSS4_740005 [Magnetospirillum sp. SS-4]|nr:hypothetical protein MTBSS4_740005 [Magnetospirillum sp. SS-4]